MPSYRRTRSRAEAPQPRTNPGTNTEITGKFDNWSLPIPSDEDDSDHALNLLKELDTLKVIDDRLLKDLDDEIIRRILDKFNVDNKGLKPTLVKKLKQIIVSGMCVFHVIFFISCVII